jgi:dihydrofolate synthase/folylpolyglutamate synthase
MSDASSMARVLDRFYRRAAHGIKPGLERIRALLDVLDAPEHRFLSVHVAGTNGKGSVCAMIESVLRAAGVRTGLYTSPHLVRFNERIRVEGRPIDDDALAPLLERAETAAVRAETSGGWGETTFFELATAAAFRHFADEAVQVAVIETGMGGRWDATNVVRPLVSVITDIAFDHMEYLGTTLAAIAGEKAGIIKPGRPVVCGVTDPGARSVVRAEAERQGAPFAEEAGGVSVRRSGAPDWSGQRVEIDTPSGRIPRLRLPLLGDHQLANTALAVGALQEIAETAGVEIAPAAWRRGLESVAWPARLQVVERDPPVLIDGAHNLHGARALADTLDALAGGKPVGLVCGVLADKDFSGMARLLASRCRRVWAVPVRNERALDPGRWASELRRAGAETVASAPLDAAWNEARAWARKAGGIVCAAGSLYLAGEILECFYDGRRLFVT